MPTITLRPTSGTGTNWSNITNAYDNNNTTGATVSLTRSIYSSSILTLNFDTSVIPEGSTINSATLTVVYKQSSSSSSRRYTPYIDINGDSNSRVISDQLTSTSSTTKTADIKSYMSNLTSITVTPYTASYISNTLTLYEVYIDVDYTEAPKTYTITVKCGEHGTVNNKTGTFTDTVNEGSSKSYSIDGDTDYRINSVKVDGVDLGAKSFHKFENISDNHTLEVTFREPKQFTVEFRNWDGTTIKTDTVQEDKNAEAPLISREGYSFCKWDTDYVMVTENLVVTASFVNTIGDPTTGIPLHLNFNNNGGYYEFRTHNNDGNDGVYIVRESTTAYVLSNKSFGILTISYGENTIKEIKMNNSPYNISSNTSRYQVSDTISSETTFESSFNIKTYTVMFLDYEGNTLEEQEIESGGDAIPPLAPDRTSEGYRFTGWHGKYTNITENTVLVAQYVKFYTISIICGENGITNPSNVLNVDENKNGAIEITANRGYAIDKINQDGVESSGNNKTSMTIYYNNVTENHVIKPTFKPVPTVVMAIENNIIYVYKINEGYERFSFDLNGVYLKQIREDLNENDSIYFDENGILHVYKIIENL